MKIILSLGLLLASMPAFAIDGQNVFEAASTSNTVTTVALSTSAPVLISIANVAAKPSLGQKAITWYSVTMFNVNSSTAAYAWGPSATVAPIPALTCANGAPLGTGTPAAPWNQTEQFIGMYLWGIGCGSSGMNIKAVHRGR